MQSVRSFGIKSRKRKFKEVVQIAKEHLDKAPDSLLSIAAAHSPEDDTIALDAWPNPSGTALRVCSQHRRALCARPYILRQLVSTIGWRPGDLVWHLQAVADCVRRSGRTCEDISAEQMIEALEYFNMPDSMWPEGLLAAVIERIKREALVTTIMSMINSDFGRVSREYFRYTDSRTYYLTIDRFSDIQCHQSDGCSPPLVPLHPIPEWLKHRLESLTKEMFLLTEFNLNKPEIYQAGSRMQYTNKWSIRIKIPCLHTNSCPQCGRPA